MRHSWHLTLKNAVRFVLALAAFGGPHATLAQSPRCVQPPPGMVAWYPLDEPLGASAIEDIAPPPDSIVNNVGTPQPHPPHTLGGGNAVPNPGMVGSALSLAGGSELSLVGKYVEVQSQAELDFGTGDFTIDAWFLSPGTGSQPGVLLPIVDKLDITSHTGFSFYLNPGHPTLQINGYTFTSAVSVAPNTWTHIAVTIRRTSGVPVGLFYINGSQDTAAAFSPPTGPVTNATPMWIGKTRLPGLQNEETIDELELFDRALTPPEISDIFGAGQAGKCKCASPPSDMVLWSTGDGNANDISGDGNNGTLQGAATYTSGEVGNAFSLNAPADFVKVHDSPSLNFGTGNLSADAWIRTTNSDLATILDKRTGTTTNPVGYTLFISSGKLGFQLSDGLPSSNYNSTGPAINDGTWHHVAVTVNRASATGGALFVDGTALSVNGGVNQTFSPLAHPGNISNTADLHIGQHLVTSVQPSQGFQGAIDELELFNRALAPGDVQAIYDARSAGKCKPSPCVAPPAGMVAWYPLDELQGAGAINDIAPSPGSLVNNVGTPVPGTLGPPGNGPFPVAGKVEGALYFYGPYIAVAPQAELDFSKGDFSIDGWVRVVDSRPGFLSPVVDKLDTGTGTGFSFYLEQNTPGAAFPKLDINGSTFASSSSLLANAHPIQNTGAWYHIAVTVQRASGSPVGTFYIDGSPAGTFTPSPQSVTNTVPMWIGKTRVPGGLCEIAIDELEIFNRALTQAEVSGIFGAGSAGKCRGKVCGMKFQDVNGNGAQDPSEPGLAGWIIQVKNPTTGAVIASTVTDSNGAYCVDVAPGTYTVAEVPQGGWTQTAPPLPSTYTVILVPNQVVANVNFGNTARAGAICVTKFEDLNGNGVQDSGEPSLSGWSFAVTDQNGSPVGTITTTPLGTATACLTVPAPGTYTVTELVLPGWTPTTPNPLMVTLSPGQTGNLIFGNRRYCAFLPPGLVSWWKFEETTGASVITDVADGNNGTPRPNPVGQGGPTHASGMVGDALTFDGSSSFVEVPNAQNLNFGTGSFAIDAWIKIPAPGSGVMPIADKRIVGALDIPYGYSFYVKDGYLGFSMSNDPGAAVHASIGVDATTSMLATNSWQHVFVTVQRSPSSATLNLYVNGGITPVATLTTALFGSLTADNPGSLIIGSTNRGRLPASAFFNGTMDEVEIFNTAVDPLDIKRIFDAGAAGKCRQSDLAITKRAANTPWTAGGTGAFTLLVQNLGPGAVPAGTVIKVTENLPAGLTLTSVSGSGWARTPTSGAGPLVVTCQYTAPSAGLAAGGSLPLITFTVNVTAAGPFVNCATVQGQLAGSVLQEPVENDRSCITIPTNASGSPCPSPGPPFPVFNFSPALPAPGVSVAFTDRSGCAPTAWSWDFGDDSSSTDQNPRHVYQQSGSYTVRQTAHNSFGDRTGTQTVVVVSGSASPVVVQIPVVLDVFGVSPAHYTSDLVAVNRSGASTRLTVRYLSAPGTPGTGGPAVGLFLDSGREVRLPDVLAFLRANGYALPPSGPLEAGTLRLTFEDVSDPSLVFAGSRTSTPNPNATVGGSFGLFLTGTPVGSAPSLSATIFALRDDTAYRSNVAIEDVPGGSGPPVLTLQVVNGNTGSPSGAPITYALGPGEWHQFGSILGSVANGYVTITKSGGGSDHFLAYGVVNDGPSTGGGTSDGSLVGTDGADGLVPIVLSVTSSGVLFTSELVLTNQTATSAIATLTYTPAATLGGSGGPYTANVLVGAGQQVRVADVITWLRDTLLMPLPANGVNQGGTLLVSGATAYVRTSNPNPDPAVGGTFGLAYPAVPVSGRARTEAWVYGLVQDAATRTNVAIADARVGNPAVVPYVLEIYDADIGSPTPVTTANISLRGGQWAQTTQVLSGTGITHGYVRVRPVSGTSDFVVYGVLNDGASPGQRTSDGSYVAMSGVQ